MQSDVQLGSDRFYILYTCFCGKTWPLSKLSFPKWNMTLTPCSWCVVCWRLLKVIFCYLLLASWVRSFKNGILIRFNKSALENLTRSCVTSALADRVRSCITGWAQRVKELWLWVIKVTRAAIGGEGGMRSGGGFRSSSQVWGSVLQRDYHGEDSSLLRTKPSVQWFNPGASDKQL